MVTAHSANMATGLQGAAVDAVSGSGAPGAAGAGASSGHRAADEVRTHFTCREGVYKLITPSEYARPDRFCAGGPTSAGRDVGGTTGPAGGNQGSNPAVRLSFATVPASGGGGGNASGSRDRLCFNHGRELYFYAHRGARRTAHGTAGSVDQPQKPIDKRLYKGTSPTCHDINRLTAGEGGGESFGLLVGFTGGQIQLIDPVRKEVGKLFNEERIIEKSRVTCIKWLPGSADRFLVAHASGCMYLYGEDAPCGGPTPPTYQLHKQGSGFSVWTCKAKTTRNPLHRWVMGEGAINDLAFSPCGKYLAVASQDGCLRVLHYERMELVGLCTSYFGGLLCACWSPDGQLVVCGGEDDLVTVWSFPQRRVVARGQGHRSWVTVVAFDPFTSVFSKQGAAGCSAADPAATAALNSNASSTEEIWKVASENGGDVAGSSSPSSASSSSCCYRLGSVAMDTQLCLWELSDDVLRTPTAPTRNRAATSGSSASPPTKPPAASSTGVGSVGGGSVATPPVGSLTQLLAHLTLHERKKPTSASIGASLTSAPSSSSASSVASSLASASVETNKEKASMRLIGTASCPRLDQAPLLEPLVCKKVSHERLTALVFRQDCIVTACQDGVVSTWSRPSCAEPEPAEGTTV